MIMGYFAGAEEVNKVIGGFLKIFPSLDPILKELSGHASMLLKLELTDPELSAEIDLSRSPLEVRIGSDADGIIGMSCPADNFHRLLLGLLPMAIGINRKKILVRGSIGKLMKAVPMFYVAPAIYPFYLESIGRPDLIVDGERLPLHGYIAREDIMSKFISALAYVIGYALGFIKKHLAPNLDILTALESLGRGLLKATGKNPNPAPEK